MKTIIHVNQHIIRRNKKHNENNPVLTVKTYKSNKYAHTAEITDNKGKVVARVVYRPEKPLSCGAHVWIETECKVKTQKQKEETSDAKTHTESHLKLVHSQSNVPKPTK